MIEREVIGDGGGESANKNKTSKNAEISLVVSLKFSLLSPPISHIT
jgi:hypothetical protein